MPLNDDRRLQALLGYRVLDTGAEQPYDELAALAALVAGAPIAAISLLDRDRHWFKARLGLDVAQAPRASGLLDAAVARGEPTVIEDVRADGRYHADTLVGAPARIGFFAAAPLLGAEGVVLGTLCVMDYGPRALAAPARAALCALAGQVVAQLELRRLRHALSAHIELHERIVASSPIGILIYDQDGNCVTANEAIARQVGARIDEVKAKNFHRNETWKRAGIYDAAIATLRSGAARSQSFDCESSFGKQISLQLNFSVLTLAGGTCLMLMSDDLAAVRRAQQERQQVLDSYAMLFANCMDGVLQTRPDGTILAANPAACAILGIPEAEVCRRGRGGLVARDDPRLPGLLAERARSGSVRGEITMVRGDGERFEAEIATMMFTDRSGTALSSIVFRDITERRRLATDLESSVRLLGNLAQRVPGVIYQYRLFPDGRSCFPFSSQGMWTIYEVTPEEVREDATPVFRRLHPADIEDVSASISASAASLQPWVSEYRVLLPRQGLRWRQGNAQPERLADGSVLWHGCITDITERKNAEATTHRLAYYDALTGLPNRSLLLDRIAQSLENARRVGKSGALLFVDLDNFKRINDARGHGVGDALLAQVAQRLAQLLRPVDMIARLGGDEFVVLINDLDPDREAGARAAMAVAERMRALLEDPIAIEGTPYSASGSIGVTMFPKGSDRVEDLLREADTAMYRAKSSGRNRIAYYESAMQAEVEERLALEQDLKDAVAAGRLQVHVQSQVDSAGTETGAELLLRWNDPVRGTVPPARFIPIAEESGLILNLGGWVLRQACAALARLQGAGLSVTLSVNISPRQFLQDDFVAQVRAALDEAAAPGAQLVFEVTEGLLIENWEDVASRMAELARMGIRFSIDDFGTGYSSLAYLKRLPLHELKIDRSFVQDTPHDPNDTAIVQSILSVARHLGLRVVAEGVETRDQAEFLLASGCDCLQGYLYARPEPFEQWLARRAAVALST